MPFGLLEVKLVPVRSCECIFKMQFHLGRYCRFTKLIRPFAASFQKKKIQSGLNRVSPPAWVPSGGLLCDQHATARGDTWPGLKQSTSAERIPGRTASSTAVGPGWKEGKQGRGGEGEVQRSQTPGSLFILVFPNWQSRTCRIKHHRRGEQKEDGPVLMGWGAVGRAGGWN